MRLITMIATVSVLALATACGSESDAPAEMPAEQPADTQQEAALEVDGAHRSVVAVVCSFGTHGKICLKSGATVYGTLVNLR